MTQIRYKTKCWSAVVVLGIILSPELRAEGMVAYAHNESLFFYTEKDTSSSNNNFFNSELVPISFMDDDSLILAAKAERNTQMRHNQRLLNHRWLASSSNNTLYGTKAVREFFKMQIFKIYHKKKDSDIVLVTNLSEQSVQIQHLDNYSIKLSKNKFVIRYKIQLDLF